MSNKIKKVVFITGAAQGIGLATVKKFLKEGWAVAATDIKKKELDEQVSKSQNQICARLRYDMIDL